MQYLTKKQIVATATKSFQRFTIACEALDERLFFERPANGKWSAAEHVQHLVTATATATFAFTLPLLLVRWVGGRPNRQSRPYEALVSRYREKLAAGGVASGRYVPTGIKPGLGHQILINKWQQASLRFLTALEENRSESALDDYLVKHPLLGRITLRELCYFTIYHTEHHLQQIPFIDHRNDADYSLIPTSP